MTRHIRVHFDGRVLIPDQPVDLPVNQPLDVEVSARAVNGTEGLKAGGSAESVLERLRRIQSIGGSFSGPVLPDEALRRESMYDDRL